MSRSPRNLFRITFFIFARFFSVTWNTIFVEHRSTSFAFIRKKSLPTRLERAAFCLFVIYSCLYLMCMVIKNLIQMVAVSMGTLNSHLPPQKKKGPPEWRRQKATLDGYFWTARVWKNFDYSRAWWIRAVTMTFILAGENCITSPFL